MVSVNSDCRLPLAIKPLIWMLISPFLFYYFISKEFILIDVFFSPGVRQAYVFSITVVLATIIWMLIGLNGKLLISKERQPLFYFSLTLCVYLLIQPFFVGFENWLINYKYVLYLFLSAGLLSLSINISPFLKLFVLGITIICLMVIVQACLLVLINGDVSASFVVPGFFDIGRDEVTYRMPFYLGFIREESIVTVINGTEIRRALSFTTEPKFFSELILVSLITLFLWIRKSYIWYMMVFVHVLALLLALSFTSFVALFFAWLLYLMKGYKYRAYHYVLFGVLVVFVAIPILNFLLELSDGYIAARIQSAISNFKNLDDVAETRLLGYGFSSKEYELKVNMLLTLHRFGIIGFFLFLGFYYGVVTLCLHNLSLRAAREKYAMLLAVVIFYVYVCIMLFEIITPLIILLILVVSKKHSESHLVCQRLYFLRG